MKNIIENIQELKKNPKGNAIIFFLFYFVFFVILFLVIKGTGNKNSLLQEYEKGNTSIFDNNGILSNNYMFDYKIKLDGIVHDYYGKRKDTVETFKYNNIDYYKNDKDFFSNNGTWVKCETPYLFSEILDIGNMNTIMNNATYESKTEYDDGKIDYNFLISSNSLNKILYNKDTDFDEVPNKIVLSSDSDKIINKISLSLNSFCMLNNRCNSSLEIELNYDMFGGVSKIDNPIK